MSKSEIRQFDNAVQLVVWSKSDAERALIQNLMAELISKLEASSS